jgi:hypothetical protein
VIFLLSKLRKNVTCLEGVYDATQPQLAAPTTVRNMKSVKARTRPDWPAVTRAELPTPAAAVIPRSRTSCSVTKKHTRSDDIKIEDIGQNNSLFPTKK